MRALLTLTILSVITFHASSSFAENEYSKLRDKLNSEKDPKPSYISNPTIDGDEADALSMKDQQAESDADCKAHRKSAKCLEYRRLARTRWLAEKNACEKNPIGKRCASFHDYEFRKMIKIQAACRGGLDSRRCATVRAGAKSSGAIERN